MGVKDIINKMKLALKKPSVEEIAEKGIEEVTETIGNIVGEGKPAKEDIKLAAEEAYKVQQEHIKGFSEEERNEFIEKFTELMVEKQKIPYEVARTYIMLMIEDENIDNEAVLKPATALPDGAVKSIIDNADLSLGHRKKLAEHGIDDEEMQEEVLEELNEEEKERRRKIAQRTIR